jgi:PAS domain S-box-containing protein
MLAADEIQARVAGAMVDCLNVGEAEVTPAAALQKDLSTSSPELDGLNGRGESTPTPPGDADWARCLGDGEMAARVRSFDWSSTSLGPIAQWPASLREVLAVCMRSRFQLAIYWGPQLVFLYNDAERDILGAMHPGVLGRTAAELCAHSWDVLGPKLQGVMETGEATWSVDEPLRFDRRGFVEEIFFTYSYSPIPDRGGIGGVLLVTSDTTDRVLAERGLRTLRELATETAQAQSAQEVCAHAAQVLAGNQNDLPFSLLFLTEDGGGLRLAGSAGLACAPDPDLWPLQHVASTQQAVRVEDVASRLPEEKAALPRAALVLPLAQAGKEAALGCLVAGLNDYRALDEAYRGFLNLVAGQIATALTAARGLEEERRRARALAELDAAKTAFFANVSHEFRTPLTLLLAPLEDTLAQPCGALSPADRERLTVVHENAQRLLKHVNDLLEFSRIGAGRLQAAREPTDLAGFTADLASMFRSPVERAGIRLVVDCPPLSQLAAVDRDMWEKIVLNLLSNALKFTHEGEIAVCLRERGQDAELCVRDTGVGVPEEELPRLFERFHRARGVKGRSFEGTGIGLALVQELVKLHGGSIRAESVHGRGSTFIVSVPLGTSPSVHDREAMRAAAPSPSRVGLYAAEAARWLPGPARTEPGPETRGPAAAGSQKQGDRPRRGAKARVLLADDNRDMREYLARLLAEAYEVEAVADGDAALAAARTRAPDLVLADVMMPGLDGFGLLRELRADPRTSTVPVVLLSARAGEESRVEGLAAGADDYLVKPFSSRELLARVHVHLEMARLRREAARRERELQAEAQQAREHAADILESITDGFIALDREWRFTHVNAEAERINGMPRGEHLGKCLWEVFPATRGTLLEVELRRAMDEREVVQFENYYEPWASWFHVKAYPSKDGGLSVFFHDVTARKRSEEALRTAHLELEQRVQARTQQLSQANSRLAQAFSELSRTEQEVRREYAQLSTVYQTTPIGLAFVDTQLRYVRVNDRLAEFNGPPADAHIGRTVREVLPNLADAIEPHYLRVLATGRPVLNVEVHRPSASGPACERSWLVSRYPVKDYQGAVIGVTTVVQEVTDRKRAEEARLELAHASRLALVGELTASIAHEINQPLGAILSNADAAEMLLDSSPPALDQVREILGDIRKDDLRASEVIRRLRALLRKRELEIQPVDLNEVTAEVVLLVRAESRRRGVTVASEPAADLPLVRGDRVHLQQVLLNLVLNGMEAMAGTPGKRRLAVRTGVNENGSAEVAVRDAGPGIPPDRLPRLFDPFFSTKKEGMGLGLSIARSLVQAHGGRLWAENNPAGGATFRFTLPTGREQPAPESHSTLEAPAGAHA